MAGIVKSVEKIELTLTAATSTATAAVGKSQDISKCVPFTSVKYNAGQSSDAKNNLCAHIDFFNDAGTDKVRASATAKTDSGSDPSMTVVIFIVEFGTGINVQQVSVTNLTGGDSPPTLSRNITVTNVTTQASAFYLYSYSCTNPPGTVDGDRDDFQDTMVLAEWNGASTTSITLSREAGDFDCNGTLYVVDCDSSEFIVDERVFAIGSGLDEVTETIGTTILADTFLIHHYKCGEVDDDLREGVLHAELTNQTTVTVTRSDITVSPSTVVGGASTSSVQVIECQNSEWDVQRGQELMTTTSETDTITAIDQNRTIAHILGHAGFPITAGRANSTTGSDINKLSVAVDFSANNTVRFQCEAVPITTSVVEWEVIQFVLQPSQTVTMSLVDLASSAQASLTNLRWSWFDNDTPGSFVAPTDQGVAETTDGSGQIVLDLTNTTLTTGQFGFLVLYDGNTLIGGYRVAID